VFQCISVVDCWQVEAFVVHTFTVQNLLSFTVFW